MFKRYGVNGYYVPLSVLSMYEEGGEIKYQEGSQVEDPMQQIMMMAQQALEEQNAEMAMQVCQMIVEMMGNNSQEQMTDQMEMNEEEEVPMARQGMEIYDDNEEELY